eukprot:m.321042 g.321042  ORF g.321042 m.321042 type:complete len:355 (-) comp19707_c0_seq16:1378-2442(-)
MGVEGVLVVCVAGIMGGLFTAPVKLMKPSWRWENFWLVYTLFGMLLLPWALVFITVPQPIAVYAHAETRAIVLGLVFGLLWGVGSVLFGLGTELVGNSLAFAIILGMTAALGAAIPLVSQHISEVIAQEGICTWVSVVVVAVGLAFLALAGMRREREQASPELRPLNDGGIDDESGKKSKGKPSFKIGLIVCLLSGVFSPMLNVGLSLGDDIKKVAKNDYKASGLNAANAVWVLVVGGGFVSNTVYCVYLLCKNQTWGHFKEDVFRNGSLAALMGVFWFGGNVVYGIGVDMIGSLGTVLGWPTFMSFMVIAANVVAAVTGEWKGTSTKSKTLLAVGLFILFIAVVVSALGGVNF